MPVINIDKLIDTDNILVVTREDVEWGREKWAKGVLYMVTDGN